MNKTRPLPLLLVSLTAAAGLATVVNPLGIAEAQADACGTGGAVVVAGTLAPRNAEGVPTGGVTGIGNRYAADGYQVQYVDYPTSLWPLGPISYDDDVVLGKAATERAVADYQARCPGKPVVVSGYSQGARVAGDVLSDAANGRPTTSGRTVSARGLSGELYSDPRRVGRNGAGGVENTLIGIGPGTTMSGPRDGGFGAVPVTQVCTQGDGVCDVPDPLYDPVGAVDALAGYFLKHGYYPTHTGADPAVGTRWGDVTCEDQDGATQDCVVHQRSAASVLAEREAALTGRTPILGRAADRVEGRTALDLAPGLPLASLRPLVGGGTDSSSGNLSVGVRAMVGGVIGVDVQRNWGARSDLSVGLDVGIGMTDGAPAVPDALIKSTRLLHVEGTVPLPDTRKLLDIALNPPALPVSGPVQAVRSVDTVQPVREARPVASVESDGVERTRAAG